MQNKNWQTAIKNHRWKEHFGPREKESGRQGKELKASKAKVEAGLSKVAAQRKDFEANKQYMTPEQIAQTEAKLSATEKQLNGNLSKINAGLSQIDTGRRKIKEAEAEMPANLRKYNEAKAEADEKFAEAKAKLDDAKKDLDKAKKEIADIKAPDTYVLDRNTNIGYACFESDSNIVDGIAKVFPIFFFLVAALVCMTTMTRMVDEQRTQIGVLKALGYSNGAVIGKYLFYSGSASFIGCVSGFLFGCWLFPLVIWKAYGMMYDFSSSLYYIINGPLAVTSLLVSPALFHGSYDYVLLCRIQRSACPTDQTKIAKRRQTDLTGKNHLPLEENQLFIQSLLPKHLSL